MEFTIYYLLGMSVLLPELIGAALTDADKKAILDKHNELRRANAKGLTTNAAGTAQPAAADMLEMVWDDTIAAGAQAWADQCTQAHAPASTPPLGENLAMWSGTFTLVSRVQDWFDEIKKKDVTVYDKYVFDSATGHYTQVVWALSGKLGCGQATCAGKPLPGYLVCRYSAAGNFKDAPIYQTGAACSKCPATQAQCNDGLCSTTAGAAVSTTTAASGASTTTAAGGSTTAAAAGASTTAAAATTVAPAAGGAAATTAATAPAVPAIQLPSKPVVLPDGTTLTFFDLNKEPRDGHPYCCFWADAGECDRNVDWMRPVCQKSCGTPGCTKEIANWCPIINRPKIDASNCPFRLVSEGAQPIPVPSKTPAPPQPSPACRDFHRLCNFWASEGECGSNVRYMEAQCAKACGKC